MGQSISVTVHDSDPRHGNNTDTEYEYQHHNSKRPNGHSDDPDDPDDPDSDSTGKGKRTKAGSHGRTTRRGGRPGGGGSTDRSGTKEGLNSLPTNPSDGGPFGPGGRRTTLPSDLNGFTPPKNWPEYCKSKHGWCYHIIAEIIKMKCLPAKIVGPLTTPTVPPKKKKQIRKKCHQVPSCVNRELAKLRKTLMSEYLMERAGLGRKGTQKRTYMVAGLIGLLVLLILLIILYFCFCYGDKERKGGNKKSKNSKKSTKGGSLKGVAVGGGSAKKSTKKSNRYSSNNKATTSSKKATVKMKSKQSPTPKSRASKKSKQSRSVKKTKAKSSRGAQVGIKMPSRATKK